MVAIVATLLAIGAGGARAAEPEWHSEQPVASGIEVPVPFGEVGDIQCWQANRCVLIAAGSGGHSVGAGMPTGIYAYDGTGWHLYSTVCGGHHGRIAWAGPDEFWTISDQQAAENAAGNVNAFWNISLCHFRDGEVVASYAEPLERANSYSHMDAAICDGPNDCWFGGERLDGAANVGAFHLHWDGLGLTTVPSRTVPEPALQDPGRSVFDFAFYQGQLYESVSVAEGDVPVGEEEPSFIHRVALDADRPFEPMTVPGLEIGGGAEDLEGFHLATVGSELWALAGAGEFTTNTVTMLKLEGGSFVQVPLFGHVFKPGDVVSGLAADPEDGYAWASFAAEGRSTAGLARLARVYGDGTVEGEVVLPRPEEELNPKGTAGPVVCPATGQCWMATSQGWLFHLGGTPVEGPDTDPAMHQLITSRPCDDACRSGNEVGLPPDDSGAEPETSRFAEVPPYEPLPKHPRKPRPLYTHLRQKLLHHTVLQLSFVLHAKAHVQLIAKEHKQVVAKTARLTLDKGKQQIRLALDPKHWPTHLSFQAHRLKKKAS
jgi:hypothetical protein